MLYRIVRGVLLFVCKFLFFLRVEGAGALPESGGAILCANHRSFWDPILLLVSSKRPLAFIAKEELFTNKLFAFVLRKMNCFPVRRDGSDIGIVKTALTLLKKGEILMIFPEGERIRKGKKPRPKPGALRLAIMGGVPLVPAGISGNFRLFRRMRVRYGENMEVAHLKDKRLSAEEYAAEIGAIMETIYGLSEGGEKA